MSRAILVALVLAAAPGRGYKPTVPAQSATVTSLGDSIFAGACGTPISSALGSLLPAGYFTSTHAISGETAHQIYVRSTNESATACGDSCGAYLLNGGVNTLKIADFAETADATVARIALHGGSSDPAVQCNPAIINDCGTMDTADYLHATHPYAAVLVVGVLPYAGCDGLTCPGLVRAGSRAREYNAQFLAACASRPWLRCYSPYAAFEDPENPDYLLPSYACADGIHLKPAGHAALAAGLKALRKWR